MCAYWDTNEYTHSGADKRSQFDTDLGSHESAYKRAYHNSFFGAIDGTIVFSN